MYRIEVSPGEETVFRTIEELGTAIRNGLVTVRSRIYHNASQKWLPIEFHPHYKKAIASLDRPRPIPAAPAAAHAPPPERVSDSAPAREPAPVPAPVRSSGPRSAAPLVPEAASNLPYIEIELPPPEPLGRPQHVRHPLPAEQHSPLPVARRRSGGGRPLVYAGGAVILVMIGYLATTFTSSRQIAAEPVPAAAVDGPVPAPADRAVAPDERPEKAPEPAPIAPAPVSVITDVVPRSGPPSQAWSSSAGALAPPVARPAPAPVGAGAAPDASIAPPPATMDLAVPALPVGDSLAPAGSTRDTAAIRRILKAVSGPKPSDPR